MITKEKINLKIKLLDKNAVIPSYAHPTDAGLDITATYYEVDDNNCLVYHTGLCVEIPDGYVGLIYPRSSISKYNLMLANSVGVIDSGYRGELLIKFKMTSNNSKNKVYLCGDRIAQLIIIPYPNVNIELVDELSDTDRGSNGFGSTD